jgi:hypothetical protein
MNYRLSLSLFFLFLIEEYGLFWIQRALKFRFGKYVSIMRPGFRLIPFVETIQVVDIRVITINIVASKWPKIMCLSIDGVVFFK